VPSVPDATIESFGRWLERYFAAWRDNDESKVEGLFSADAAYYLDPFREPTLGRAEIVRMWIEDEWQQTDHAFSFEALAVNGDTGIAHWTASIVRHVPDIAKVEMDGILTVRFDDEGRCREHREWVRSRETPIDDT
jgi:ketosteroid isomerase-like protein